MGYSIRIYVNDWFLRWSGKIGKIRLILGLNLWILSVSVTDPFHIQSCTFWCTKVPKNVNGACSSQWNLPLVTIVLLTYYRLWFRRVLVV